MNGNDRRNFSLPQERRSLTEQFSSFGARINRALSRGRSPERPAKGFDNESLASSTATVVSTQGVLEERSVSRGREGFRHSSGRGGLGNIVTPSSVPENATLEHSTSPVRGRDATRPSVPNGLPFSSTGRGGAGNIHPPSRETLEPDAITLVPSRSSNSPNVRSPSQTSPSRNMLSTGRGGVGNIKRNPTEVSTRLIPTKGATIVHKVDELEKW